MKISPVNERNLGQHLRYQLLLLLLRQVCLHQHRINIISSVITTFLIISIFPIISIFHIINILIGKVVSGTIFAIVMLASQIAVTALVKAFIWS